MISVSHALSCALIAGLSIGFAGPSWSAAAKEIRFKDMPLEVKEGDRLIVSGIRAQIRLQPSVATAAVLRMRKVLQSADRSPRGAIERFEALTVNTRREGNTIYIEGKGPISQADLSDWLKPQGAPELILEIDAPSVPVEVALREGSVSIQNWKQPVAVSLVEGVVKTSGSEGVLRLQQQKGEVKIETHRGGIELESYGAKVSAQNVDGDVRLVNFGGDSTLKQIKGNMDVRANAGSTQVSKSSGSVDFELGRGALSIQEFDGAIRGQTELGSVSASVVGEADVQIDSGQGGVSVQLPSGSGALVRLQSDDGSISAPESIRPGTNGSMKTASGRLKGTGPRGNVVIKSKTGVIRVR